LQDEEQVFPQRTRRKKRAQRACSTNYLALSFLFAAFVVKNFMFLSLETTMVKNLHFLLQDEEQVFPQRTRRGKRAQRACSTNYLAVSILFAAFVVKNFLFLSLETPMVKKSSLSLAR
jgi:hypothetical protein